MPYFSSEITEIQKLCSIHRNASFFKITVWIHLFETNLEIISHSELNYCEIISQTEKKSAISDKDLIMFCHLLLSLLTKINSNFILCV